MHDDGKRVLRFRSRVEARQGVLPCLSPLSVQWWVEGWGAGAEICTLTERGVERGRGRLCTNAFSSPAGKKEIETAPTTVTVAWEDRTKLLNIQEQGGNIPNCFPRHICNTPPPLSMGPDAKAAVWDRKTKTSEKGEGKIEREIGLPKIKTDL